MNRILFLLCTKEGQFYDTSNRSYGFYAGPKNAYPFSSGVLSACLLKTQAHFKQGIREHVIKRDILKKHGSKKA